MHVMKQLVIAALIAFSSAFFIGTLTMEKAEALCPKIGQYHDHGKDGVGNTHGNCKTALSNGEASEVKDLTGWIQLVVYPLAGVGLALSVIVVVFAGYLYVTAGADSKNVQKAKGLLIAAVIGIFITLSTFVIARMFAGLTGFM
jgi:hypothetical protein